MNEGFRKNVSEENESPSLKGGGFDRESEKNQRKEIRNILVSAMSDTLKEMGFKKTQYSLWSRHLGETWQIVYMQRSQTDHRYYIEAGICHERDIPRGEKIDIVRCKNRERIEWIVADIERKQTKESEDVDEKIKQKVNDVQEALNFEIPHAHERYPNEYFVPSVSLPDAEEKIKKIKHMIKEYLLLWFTDLMGHTK